MKKRKILKSTISFVSNRLSRTLFIMPIVLTIAGLFFIFEASSVSAFRQLGDSFYFLKRQLVFFVVGIGLMVFFSKLNYKKLYNLAIPALFISIVSLILVIIPHITDPVSGARRWISIAGFTFQPSEFTKLAMILYLSSWFVKKERERFISFAALMIFIILLIMGQPDLGTATIIVLLSVCMYILSGEDMKYLFASVPFGIAGLFFLIKTSEYRTKRFLTFLNPNLDIQGISYHLNQILISLSAGGLVGRGFSESRQKYQFLPEANTDSIFAIIGEEAGFIGGVTVIIAYMYLLYLLYKVVRACPDRFGQLLSAAVFALLALQVAINLSGMVNLLPLTGVPLPFISYGGSNLLVMYILMGVAINIGRRNNL